MFHATLFIQQQVVQFPYFLECLMLSFSFIPLWPEKCVIFHSSKFCSNLLYGLAYRLHSRMLNALMRKKVFMWSCIRNVWRYQLDPFAQEYILTLFLLFSCLVINWWKWSVEVTHYFCIVPMCHFINVSLK